jgi:predicted small lipoprotein YifL
MSKKAVASLLVLLILIPFAACGSKPSPESTNPPVAETDRLSPGAEEPLSEKPNDSEETSAEAVFMHRPSGSAFIRSVLEERGQVPVTDTMRREFNQFAKDYRWFFLPETDGYESFFEMGAFGEPRFGEAVSYVLSYLNYPERTEAGEMQRAIQTLFAAKGRYDDMPDQTYRKRANYQETPQGRYYSPWPEGVLDPARMFCLLDEAFVEEGADGSVSVQLHVKCYYFEDPQSCEPGRAESWLAEQAQKMGMGELQAAEALVASGQMGGQPPRFVCHTVLQADPNGKGEPEPRFLSNAIFS